MMREGEPIVDEKAIDALFAKYDSCHAPGVVVGISVSGRPVYRKGFGLANLEQPIALTPSTKVRIASITKHISCAAFLLLCEEGDASLDDPIGNYISKLNAGVAAVPVRSLMAHTSGILDAEEIHNQFNGTDSTASIDDILSLYALNQPAIPHGTTWQYNNGAYLLLGKAIESITGRSFGEFLRDRILEPAGLFDTALHGWSSDFVAGSAAMHMTSADGSFCKSHIRHELGADGGLVSTIDDMLRWLRHLESPGCEPIWRSLLTRTVLSNGASTAYGLGLMLGQYRGLATISHSGGLMGARSFMLKAPAAGLDIIVVSNRHDVSTLPLVHQILDVCLPDLGEPLVALDTQPAVGWFHSSTTGRTIGLGDRNGCQIASFEGVEVPMLRTASDQLNHGDWASHLLQRILLRGDRQSPSAIEFEDFGNSDLLLRIEADQERPDHLAGRYLCESLGVTAQITADGDLRFKGPFGRTQYILEHIGPHLWKAKSMGVMPWCGILRFDEDSFFYSTYSTRNLHFRRQR